MSGLYQVRRMPVGNERHWAKNDGPAQAITEGDCHSKRPRRGRSWLEWIEWIGRDVVTRIERVLGQRKACVRNKA